jgi:Na+/H+-dicarboxylate symporter
MKEINRRNTLDIYRCGNMSVVIQNPEIGKDRDAVDVEANFEEPQTISRVSKLRNALLANVQLVAIVVSVILGFLIGILIHDAVQESTDPSTEKVIMYIKFPGELFIRMLRMIIIPFTVSSIVVALGEIDTGSAGKLGKRTFLYYLTTTVVATVLGLVLVKVIRPGEDSKSKTDVESEPSQTTAFDSFLDLLSTLSILFCMKTALLSMFS